MIESNGYKIGILLFLDLAISDSKTLKLVITIVLALSLTYCIFIYLKKRIVLQQCIANNMNGMT